MLTWTFSNSHQLNADGRQIEQCNLIREKVVGRQLNQVKHKERQWWFCSSNSRL